MISDELWRLYVLADIALRFQSPVMSGNTKAGISLHSMGGSDITIVVDAPSYDLKKWRDEGVIEHDGKYNYANAVNLFGGFFKRNKSMHWANRACFDAARCIANEIGAEVINELEL